jgi:hypothetical protein
MHVLFVLLILFKYILSCEPALLKFFRATYKAVCSGILPLISSYLFVNVLGLPNLICFCVFYRSMMLPWSQPLVSCADGAAIDC